ncbi:hypothetical protein [Coleofasciculus sp.]|uniref:hypothetical protein n=1 Tax=Coleofasciculus sp. TaxID=3100458 RepID=UPI003A2BE314
MARLYNGATSFAICKGLRYIYSSPFPLLTPNTYLAFDWKQVKICIQAFFQFTPPHQPSTLFPNDPYPRSPILGNSRKPNHA